MKSHDIHLYIEGKDDKRFIEKIIIPILRKKGYKVHIRTYANEPRSLTNVHLNIRNKNNEIYFFFRDSDTNFSCTTKIKEITSNGYNLRNDCIIIVKKEIESWYLAGLTDRGCSNCEIPIANIQKTEMINKERFLNLKPKKFYSEIEFRIEILKHYDLKLAKKRNESLAYFLKRIEIIEKA